MKTPFLFFFLLLFVSCQHNADTEEKSPLPNIIIILADDLGYGDPKVYNH